ncbi:MAG TPA: galactose-1-epimerase, partial [Phycisphaerae bacterium]
MKMHIGLALLAAVVCMGQTMPAAPSTGTPSGPGTSGIVPIFRRVVETDFGTMPDGTPVKLYTLSNAKGMQARICSYGGTIAGIKAADKEGKFTNVLACADALPQTIGFSMQAQTIGRVANRIAGGKFTLDGKEYTTEVNNGPNTLHSGKANFGTRVWEGKALAPTEHEGAVQLTMVSKDGDGGFPGTLTLKVTYSLNDDNEFKLAYEATTDKATPVNVTNHGYYNLAGAPG